MTRSRSSADSVAPLCGEGDTFVVSVVFVANKVLIHEVVPQLVVGCLFATKSTNSSQSLQEPRNPRNPRKKETFFSSVLYSDDLNHVFPWISGFRGAVVWGTGTFVVAVVAVDFVDFVAKT